MEHTSAHRRSDFSLEPPEIPADSEDSWTLLGVTPEQPWTSQEALNTGTPQEAAWSALSHADLPTDSAHVSEASTSLLDLPDTEPPSKLPRTSTRTDQQGMEGLASRPCVIHRAKPAYPWKNDNSVNSGILSHQSVSIQGNSASESQLCFPGSDDWKPQQLGSSSHRAEHTPPSCLEEEEEEEDEWDALKTGPSTAWRWDTEVDAVGRALAAVRDKLLEGQMISRLCSATSDGDSTNLPDNCGSNASDTRAAVLRKIEGIIETVVRGLGKDEPPSLESSSRTVWSNVRFEEDRGLVMAPSTSVTSTRFDVPQSAQKFALTVKVLSKIYRLVQTNTYCTKRELYYQDAQLFGSQGVLDDIVDTLCCMLGHPRWDLHVLATSKGLVAGDLQFTTADGEYVDCSNSSSGVLIPNHVHGISNVRSAARCVLVVEKDATFQALLDQHVSTHVGSLILVTGKGFPDVNTRLLVRLLWDCLHLPVLALVDADPHGIEIMSIYKYGSRAQSFEAEHLTLPSILWLGVLPSDVQRLRLPRECTLPLTARDRAKCQELLSRPYISAQSAWQREISLLLSCGAKAEIQCLSGLGADFLVRVYLPSKLRHSSWL